MRFRPGDRALLAPRVSLSICGQHQSSGPPPSRGAAEWQQLFEFKGMLQDFMQAPLQIKVTSTGGQQPASRAQRGHLFNRVAAPVPRAKQGAGRGWGTLRVHLIDASGLKAADLNGKSDPYVRVRVGGLSQESRVVAKSLSPAWDQALEFRGNLEEFHSTGLALEVMDKDRFTRDDPLGSVQVGLQRLFDATSNATHEYDERLSTQGTIRFRLSWEVSAKVSDIRSQFNVDDAHAVATVTPAVLKQHGFAAEAAVAAPAAAGVETDLAEAAVALELAHGLRAEYRQPLMPHGLVEFEVEWRADHPQPREAQVVAMPDALAPDRLEAQLQLLRAELEHSQREVERLRSEGPRGEGRIHGSSYPILLPYYDPGNTDPGTHPYRGPPYRAKPLGSWDLGPEGPCALDPRTLGPRALGRRVLAP